MPMQDWWDAVTRAVNLAQPAWSGWEKDERLAAQFEPQLAAILPSPAVADLVAQWAAAMPAGAPPAAALAWLQRQGLSDLMVERILPVLQAGWGQGWGSGWGSPRRDQQPIRSPCSTSRRGSRHSRSASEW